VGTISGADITWGAEHTTGGSYGQSLSHQNPVLAELGELTSCTFMSVPLTLPTTSFPCPAPAPSSHGTSTVEASMVDSYVGQLGVAASLTASTPGAYPAAAGNDRVTVATWAKNMTDGSSTITMDSPSSMAMFGSTLGSAVLTGLL